MHTLLLEDNAEVREPLRRRLLQAAKRRDRFTVAARGASGLRMAPGLDNGRFSRLIDRTRIQQFWINLIGNAIQCSVDAGPIEVQQRCRVTPSQRVRLAAGFPGQLIHPSRVEWPNFRLGLALDGTTKKRARVAAEEAP